MNNKDSFKKPDLDLIRLLGRYAEAYFSKDGKDLPKALNEVEKLIIKRELLARVDEVEMAIGTQGIMLIAGVPVGRGTTDFRDIDVNVLKARLNILKGKNA